MVDCIGAQGSLIAFGLTALIRPTHTPRAHYAKVTQLTITKTSASTAGRRRSAPPASYTDALKKVQLAQWG